MGQDSGVGVSHVVVLEPKARSKVGYILISRKHFGNVNRWARADMTGSWRAGHPTFLGLRDPQAPAPAQHAPVPSVYLPSRFSPLCCLTCSICSNTSPAQALVASVI